MIKGLFRFVLIVFGVLFAIILVFFLWFRWANHTNGTIVSSGTERSYLLYVPDSYDAAAPTPLVITLHGFAQWPAHQMGLSHWNELADEYGFIVVYPEGRKFPLRWQAGSANSTPGGIQEDIQFISDLIDTLQAEYNIDPARIFTNGMSNGAGMTFVLSCELSERIAAMGLVAGAYAYPWEVCAPARQTPAMVFHGTEDQIVPFGGSIEPSAQMVLPDIPSWVGELAGRNGCSETVSKEAVSSDVSALLYQDCTEDVVFYTIQGGGHTWPGGEGLPYWLTGYTSMQIDATRMLWDFFQVHPLE